jgi:hypothetical protein
MDYESIYNEALAAAKQSTSFAREGQPQGFAWVIIDNTRGPFIKWLKKNEHGRSDSVSGGYRLTSREVSSWAGSNIQVKEKACQAFCDVLAKYDIISHTESRLG